MSQHHPQCEASHGDALPCTCADFMPPESAVTDAERAEREADLRTALSEPLPPRRPMTELTGADHDRALRFVKSWLSADYDPEQHPEWLNLARAYAQLSRLYEGISGGSEAVQLGTERSEVLRDVSTLIQREGREDV